MHGFIDPIKRICVNISASLLASCSFYILRSGTRWSYISKCLFKGSELKIERLDLDQSEMTRTMTWIYTQKT